MILLLGPTGVGKSDVAVAWAERLNAEIVSCDSMQVYRGLNIGTGKSSEALRRRVPHHLLDVADPGEHYSAGRYAREAWAAAERIQAKGRVPLVVGGTWLYAIALVDGLSTLPEADPGLRQELQACAEDMGSAALHQRLVDVDPKWAEDIHPNDVRRIIRALEIHELSTASALGQRDVRSTVEGRHWTWYALTRERAALYQRIDDRVMAMWDAGLEAEVRDLQARGVWDITAQQAVGYREILSYLDGTVSREEALRLHQRNTRRYAKRQLSWLRGEPRVHWIEIAADETPDRTAQRLQEAHDSIQIRT